MVYLKYLKAVAIGLLIGYIGYLNVRLWYKGLDLGATSIYSYRPAPYIAEHTKKWKKAKVETFPCVQVVGKKMSTPQTNDQHTSQTNPSYTLGEVELGEWRLKTLPYGGIASAQLDSTGVTRLVVTGNAPRFLEVGRQRALGLSIAYPLIGQNHSLSYDLYLRQDLLRTGPIWWQGQVSAGHWSGSTNDLDLSVQLRAEVRF
jgi:hypothetical protein